MLAYACAEASSVDLDVLCSTRHGGPGEEVTASPKGATVLPFSLQRSTRHGGPGEEVTSSPIGGHLGCQGVLGEAECVQAAGEEGVAREEEGGGGAARAGAVLEGGEGRRGVHEVVRSGALPDLLEVVCRVQGV
eukprot:CAMPEP_0206007290 /NCGR_PEP_ID=MMETSP1464-20131121/5680_1 /ASSEMBLY_ACC=CAM_ASM_001124 /TAXON_ID=119497 /ORGANISM="Exanthemachrysis gayraliae, Strain RCC1523" /LENGTH=133 /DNA_ID=CAMNT_0053380783 /DNA_START=177 /DNA_END=576 /DNA_ORIENTATION=+